MDYEKKYNEALERAKKFYNELAACRTKQKVAAIFPELRESEDEKIRKCIGMALTDVEEQRFMDYGTSLKDCLSWLEKQKEQDWNKKPCLTCQEYEKGHKQGYTEGCTAGYNKAMKEVEQKEQKPVVTHGETYHVDTIGTQQVIAGKMPQKPVEWSEEDEDNLHRVIRVLEDNDSDWKELSDWLKSLRPSWKPSEEQMKALQNAVALTACDKELARLYNQLKKL